MHRHAVSANLKMSGAGFSCSWDRMEWMAVQAARGRMEVRENMASQDHRCALHTPLCLYSLHVQQRPSSVKGAFAAKASS